MAKSFKKSARLRVRAGTDRTRAEKGGSLMVIDHARLQSAAWAEFHTARKQLEKTARDLHRHEEIDIPAYETWLHRTFPIQITTLRELHAEVSAKAQKIRAVQIQAMYAGGSLKRLWRQQKEREAKPEPPRDEHERDAASHEGTHRRRRFEAEPDDFKPTRGPTPTAGAREIYRRLVQRLHPDRGGEWTAARKRLWHEVQQAWNAADTDWLSRLEIEWETAAEIISQSSPLSRLRAAIEELHAARRDAERKLREYRQAPQWRFTRNERNRPYLHRRIESSFEHDIEFLRRQLEHLNRTIAAWEEDWTRSDTGRKSRHRRARRY